MGITVHFAGTAQSEAAIMEVFDLTAKYGRERGWEVRLGDPVRQSGVSLLPHPDCEPINLWFTKTRRISEYCKTQFAGPDIHVEVIGLLAELEPYFSKFVVYDEADDLCEGDDYESLHKAFNDALAYIEAGLSEYPGSKMMVRLPDGRIADLVG